MVSGVFRGALSCLGASGLLVLAACDTQPTFVSALDGSASDATIEIIDAAKVFDASVDFDAPPDLCGNGSLDSGEACDPLLDACCNSSCTGPGNEGLECQPSFGVCDEPEFCDGISFVCPVDTGVVSVCGDGVICGAETCDDGAFPPEDFDGCDSVCFVEQGSVCTGEPSFCSFSPIVPGELVITEIQKDPTAVPDTAGEWFEVFNPTELDFELMGLEVSDGSGESFIIDQPLFLPAQSFAVLGNNGDTATNGEVLVDYVYSGFTLNDTDAIIITNLDEPAEIDAVIYDAGMFPSTPGASLSLAPPFLFDHISNDFGANWCASISGMPSGDFGTPGFDNFCSEIMNGSVEDAMFLATGEHLFSISPNPLPLFVDGDFDGGGWVLVGRGRENWAWNEQGVGFPETIKDGLGSQAAFTPSYLPSFQIQQLIDNSVSAPSLLNIEIRIKRAAAADGSSYQNVFWLPLSQSTWSWLFDGGGPSGLAEAPFGLDVDAFVGDSVLGLGQPIFSANTEDTMLPIPSDGPDDYTRIFTWAWSGNGLAQGFAYGMSVTAGDTSPASFLLNSGAGHSLPYTEVYIRLNPSPQ